MGIYTIGSAPGEKETTLDRSGFSTRGTLITASVVSHPAFFFFLREREREPEIIHFKAVTVYKINICHSLLDSWPPGLLIVAHKTSALGRGDTGRISMKSSLCGFFFFFYPVRCRASVGKFGHHGSQQDVEKGSAFRRE